ncbi:NADH:ubiquinone oxidoreductase subunit N [Pseudomonas lundensis]|uniref:NADH:ubiquinone oxidoreductase subunit N n=1 Tax=Pseudomonas lundensis TaxID=86185 RepID=A0ABX4GMV1_9PSED|nr:NADH:ubiquinone oxidoreductase subunit N [Pseudomonas lundensis]NMZ55347.1 NADH:ubiquinone oxidoreductase subunit N [Pseudomonas lundensis]OZY28150.1 NADH:ubiquinone oxidoreductase subunit N [Pseudomonas lundensis]OZY55265.1 NADH:ubiquinone oxidoreductase subunit N [Pseudomonas lundensis]QOF93674.1 NADH:ubiquinone oxidoreductase subunit N [Pseudomonas lundensis]
MKNPYAPGFWCAVVAVVLLSATYFYGIMLAHQIDTALFFLDSASALIAVLAIAVVAWALLQTRQIKKRQVEAGQTRVLIWDTKIALRRVETVFDRYFWGSYWQPGRTFEAFMGELTATPLEKSLDALKSQCLQLDKALPSEERQWLDNARELADVAAAMARERYQLDYSDSSVNSVGEICVDHDLEVLVYTWSAILKNFDHRLDEIERLMARSA